MTGLNLSINEEVMRELVGKAILDGISAEARTELIQTAINYLVAPSVNTSRSYGQPAAGPSPLEEAFKNAVYSYGQTVVREFVEKDAETRTLLEGKIRDLVTRYRDRVNDPLGFEQELNAWIVDYLMKQAKDEGRREY